jgi:antagonist of KipI
VSILVIDRPGMLTTVQDLGRRGYQAFGVSVSGAMDTWSARLANRLVGNPDRFAVLEVTMVGPRFTTERDTWIAVAGAEFEVRIATDVKRSPFVCRVARGTEVVFGGRTRGARAYLAVDGGIATSPLLGSASTHLLARMGGFEGRALRAGDRVPLGPARSELPASSAQLELASIHFGAIVTLSVLPGMVDDAVGEQAFATLCREPFVVSVDSDRMGYRLSNTGHWPAVGASQLSGPTAAGAIQLPPDGTPILLMADRQTTGGYVQIGVLQRADRPAAGQLAPGDRVAFAATTHQSAAAAHAALEARLNATLAEICA